MKKNPKLLSGILGTLFFIIGYLLISAHSLIHGWSINFAELYLSPDHHITTHSVMMLSTYILTFATFSCVLGIATYLFRSHSILFKSAHIKERLLGEHSLYKTQFVILLKICIPAICILAIIRWQKSIPISHLTRDPLAIFEGLFYFGLLSNIGAIFWCFSAAICLFTCAVLHKKNNNDDLLSFLLFFGLFTSLLCFDDFFLFHDSILPLYLHIDEKALFGIYGIAISILLIRFRKLILKTEYLILFFAFGFFSCSILTDLSKFLTPKHLRYLVEDGFKFLGIICWSTYLTRLCLNHVKAKLHAASRQI